MKCPKCEGKTEIRDTREIDDGQQLRRRRKCLECDHRFSTYETHQHETEEAYSAFYHSFLAFLGSKKLFNHSKEKGEI